MDDRDEYEPEAEVPIEPVTERVRIIGAQTAGAVGGQGLDDSPARPKATVRSRPSRPRPSTTRARAPPPSTSSPTSHEPVTVVDEPAAVLAPRRRGPFGAFGTERG